MSRALVAGLGAARPRCRFGDVDLDAPTASAAAAIVAAGVVTGVADAYLGATVRGSGADEVVVITSDPRDIAAACAPTSVTIVASDRLHDAAGTGRHTG